MDRPKDEQGWIQYFIQNFNIGDIKRFFFWKLLLFQHALLYTSVMASWIIGYLTDCSLAFWGLHHRKHLTFALLALCEEKPPMIMGTSHKGPIMRSFSKSWHHQDLLNLLGSWKFMEFHGRLSGWEATSDWKHCQRPAQMSTAEDPSHKVIMSSKYKFYKNIFFYHMKNNNQIRSQFCPCQDSSAVMTSANLWPNWIIRIGSGTKEIHDDVIKWKSFPRYWPFVRGIHRSTVNSPHKGQRRGALMFSLIYARINGWVNNCEAGDLRCHRVHYDGIVMLTKFQLRAPKIFCHSTLGNTSHTK